MRTFWPTLAFLLCVTAAASAATDDEIRQKIVGVWGESPACAEGRLAFNADKTFSSENAEAASKIEGGWEIVEGKLKGTVGADPMPEMAVIFEEETLVLAGDGGEPDRLVRCAPR
jgi:hypothetical protein